MSHHTQARLAQIYRTPVRKVKTLSALERKLWAHHVIAQAKRARAPHAAVASARVSGSDAKPAHARTSGRQARGKPQAVRAHRRGSGRGSGSASRAAVDQTPVDQVLLSPTSSAVRVCVRVCVRCLRMGVCVCLRVRACACTDMPPPAQVHLLPVRQQRAWARDVLRQARRTGALDSARAPSKQRASEWRKWAYVESPVLGGCGGACQ